MPINPRRIRKLYYMHSENSFSHKEKVKSWNLWGSGMEDDCVKWNKPYSRRQILQIFCHIQNLRVCVCTCMCALTHACCSSQKVRREQCKVWKRCSGGQREDNRIWIMWKQKEDYWDWGKKPWRGERKRVKGRLG